ncbi:MAG TPA: Ig-like domain-containing protein [Streptosporangiaceae bacterium]|nr:Ig-like domain-containing protein [Streptosporangiaceae bacterium]
MHISVVMPGRHRVHGVLTAGTALGAALALAVSGCSGGDADKAVDAAAKVTILPGDGTGKARPDIPISVLVKSGKLLNVTVSGKGTKVMGAASADGRQWRSRWTLVPNTQYHVIATALGEDGKTQTVTSSFKTAKPKQTLAAAVTAPSNGETVGVGMPIMLHFDRKVTNKAQVERSLEVRSSTPVVGAWRWYTDQDVYFRTKKYWPRRTKVRLIAHMSGVRAGRGLYGTKDLDHAFSIGDEHISVASSRRHHMIVRKNGKKVRDIPISMGRGGIEKYTTTNGVHLAMEKSYLTVMDSSTVGCGPGCPDYYRQDVYWTVRISDSGEFVHSAPWSVGSQGYSNVSHGCVNASPGNAIWFYHFTRRGDIVRVTGTNRELTYDNGWGFWQLPWKRWVKGSATKRAFTTRLLNGKAAPVRHAAAHAKPPARTPTATATPSTPPPGAGAVRH